MVSAQDLLATEGINRSIEAGDERGLLNEWAKREDKLDNGWRPS